ncbi:MAG: zinc ribbon domain-containing protein [Bacillota bacterium]
MKRKGSGLVPIYEFKCSACGHKFETLCRVGETEGGLECPRCGAKSLTRLVSAFRVGGGSGGGNGSGSGCSGCSSRSCSTCR